MRLQMEAKQSTKDALAKAKSALLEAIRSESTPQLVDSMEFIAGKIEAIAGEAMSKIRLTLEPWAYAIETPGGDMYDSEYAVFADERSCRDQVENLNEGITEGQPKYKVVPLHCYRSYGPNDKTCTKPKNHKGPHGKRVKK